MAKAKSIKYLHIALLMMGIAGQTGPSGRTIENGYYRDDHESGVGVRWR